MPRPHFILVAGPNGAGKSTYTETVRRRWPATLVIDPDAIAKQMTGSFALVDQEQASAGRKAIELVRNCIETGESFSVESTISGRLYLRYAREATQAGFRTVLIYIGLSSPELSAERVANRVSVGGHNIPAADIIRRYPKSMANVVPHIRAFENAYIYDNSHSSDQGYQWVASYRHGLLHKKANQVPGWLANALDIPN